MFFIDGLAQNRSLHVETSLVSWSYSKSHATRANHWSTEGFELSLAVPPQIEDERRKINPEHEKTNNNGCILPLHSKAQHAHHRYTSSPRTTHDAAEACKPHARGKPACTAKSEPEAVIMSSPSCSWHGGGQTMNWGRLLASASTVA